MMETFKQTSKEYFKTLSIIHLALTTGLVTMNLIGFYLITSGEMSINLTDLNSTLLYLVSVFVLGGLLGSNWFYNNKLSRLRADNDLNTKMTNYRGVLIIRYALLEGSAFFAFVAALLTSNLSFFAFAALVIIFMIIWRPTINSVILDLQINRQEISIVENPDSILTEFTNTNNIN